MSRARIWVALLLLVVIVALVFGVESWRRAQVAALPVAEGEPTLVPGGVPIYLEGRLRGSFQPSDLERLNEVRFVDAAEGKEQTGWLLRDILLLYISPAELQADTQITVSSSSRNKAAVLNWAEVDDAENMVMFDLSNRSTLKLVSARLEQLDTREEWVQDADRIEVHQP